MLDFSPNEEQEEVRHLARSLALDHLRPQGRTAEKSGDISPALMQTITQTGLTSPFPELYGGSGALEAVTYVLIAEELGYGDVGLALNIFGSMMGPVAIALAGNEQQQAEFLPLFCDPHSGSQERGSFAFAERTGGFTLADINTQATLNANQEYIISGTKRDVIHGGNSHPRVLLFRMEGTGGNDGLCAAILSPQHAHVHIRQDEQKLGLLATPTTSYNIEQAVISADALLGTPGHSGVIRTAALFALLRAGVACGLARAALEYSGHYAEERIAFGRPIVSYQGIAFMIAEMAMKLDAVRLLLWNAASQWDQEVDPATLVRDAEAAQYQAVKLARSATTDAVQIMGGAGFMQDHPAEMWMRNAAAMD